MNSKRFALLGLILLIVGVVGSVLTFKEVKADFVTEEETVSKNNITHIDIEANNEKVEVIPTSGSDILIKYSGEKVEQKKDTLSVEEEGNTLKIEIKDRQFFSFQFNFFIKQSSLKVYLPEKVYEKLKVDLGNGAIVVQDLSVEEIDVETNNGKIELDGIKADSVKANTHNGKVDLQNIEGQLHSRVNNGSISLETENLDRVINFETDNGSISIQTDQEPTDAIIDAKTNNGRVTIFGNTNWDSVIGNGTHKIKLVTKNGSINVTK